MKELNDTAHKVLDAAEHLTQTVGFNAFSYKDIQQSVGIKTSSIHYYFPSKSDLSVAMIERYSENFRSALKTITQETAEGIERLRVLGNIYVDGVKKGKFCLCGMIASDFVSLPDIVSSKLCDFFRMVEDWISHTIEFSKTQKSVRRTIDNDAAATHYLALLEGGMLIARVRQEPRHLVQIIEAHLQQLQP